MKKLFITVFSFCCSLAIFAQDSISSVILNMPDEVICGLQASHKELLVSNPDDTAAVKIETSLYPKLERVGFTKNFIRIKTSDAGDVQIKLLPLINNSNIICVVKTVCGQVSDSQIKFYTTDWQQIEATTLYPIINADKFTNPDADRNSDDYKNAVSAIDINPLKITLSPIDDTASIEFDIKPYLSDSDYNMVKRFFSFQPITLSWDRISFKEKQ